MPGVDSVMKLGDFFLQAGNADFFRTYGTRIVRGRAFDDHDGAQSPRVMVVGERMAAALWPGAIRSANAFASERDRRRRAPP